MRERSEPQPGSAPSFAHQPLFRADERSAANCRSVRGRGRGGSGVNRSVGSRGSGGVNRGASGVNGGGTSVASGGSGITSGFDGLAGGVGSFVGSSSGVSSGFLRGLDGLFLLGAASEGQGGEGSSESDLRVH